jgi:hypothetical protein
MTAQQTLIQWIKSNLEDKIPTWEELEWWDSLLDDSTLCPTETHEIDSQSYDSPLPLCRIEVDLNQVVWTDLTSIPQDKILDLGKATRTHVNSIYIRGTLSFKGYK